jgi:hypothetical protein
MKSHGNKSARLSHALELRDAALTIIKRIGIWNRTARDTRHLSAHANSFEIFYRTPFQRMPQVNNALKYRAAQLGLTAPKNLPYGLDIWAPNKVMNIEWDDKGNVELVSFHPGAWELELFALGREPINLQGVRLARVRYCPDSGQIPQRAEMT